MVSGYDEMFSSANFRARFRVLLSLPWFSGRFGILWDRQDLAVLIGKFGPSNG